MAITLSVLRFLCSQREIFHLTGERMLTLGVQDVHGTHATLAETLRSHGVQPFELPESERLYTVSQIVPQERRFAHVKDLFRMSGHQEVETLDFSDAEGADHLHDLNNPLPEHLTERYDAIFDGGVLEHVFDTVEALHSCMKMLKVGGTICHIVPLYGWHTMCYYNFQPMFLHEVYAANGFERLRTYLNYYPQCNEWQDEPLDYREYQYGDETLFIRPGFYTNVCVFATKTRPTGEITKPIQGFYARYHNAPEAADAPAPAANVDGRLAARVKERLPSWLRRPLLTVNRQRIQVQERLLPRRISRKLWMRQRTKFLKALDRTRVRRTIRV